jgi:hypothetical protein
MSEKYKKMTTDANGQSPEAQIVTQALQQLETLPKTLQQVDKNGDGKISLTEGIGALIEWGSFILFLYVFLANLPTLTIEGIMSGVSLMIVQALSKTAFQRTLAANNLKKDVIIRQHEAYHTKDRRYILRLQSELAKANLHIPEEEI